MGLETPAVGTCLKLRKDELSLVEFQRMLETKELRELFQACDVFGCLTGVIGSSDDSMKLG